MNGHFNKCFKRMNALGIFYTPRSVPRWFSFLFILFMNLFIEYIIIHLVYIYFYLKWRFSLISVFRYRVASLKISVFLFLK